MATFEESRWKRIVFYLIVIAGVLLLALGFFSDRLPFGDDNHMLGLVGYFGAAISAVLAPAWRFLSDVEIKRVE